MQYVKRIHIYEIRKQHFMSNNDAFRTLLKVSSSGSVTKLYVFCSWKQQSRLNY